MERKMIDSLPWLDLEMLGLVLDKTSIIICQWDDIGHNCGEHQKKSAKDMHGPINFSFYFDIVHHWEDGFN